MVTKDSSSPYYFICYQWTSPTGSVLYENEVINEHPLEWLYNSWRNFNDRTRLISWVELSREEYEKHVKPKK